MEIDNTDAVCGTDASPNRERRTVIKKIALGATALAGYSVLPDKWTRPIVGQVVLPAHAGTSGSSTEPGTDPARAITLVDPCSVTLLYHYPLNSGALIRVEGFVTPPVSGLPVTIIVRDPGNFHMVTATTTTDATGSFVSIIYAFWPYTNEELLVSTTVAGANGTATCSVNTGDIPQGTPPPGL